MALTLLYRGDLESCNYDCSYCPFAKKKDSREELAADARALEKFVAWAESRRDLRILFTPWGEALIRPFYQEAFVRLSHCVERVSAQTNLSYPLDWLGAADCHTAGLWCTYHPSQTTRDKFLAQCARLDALGVGYSVGMVGLRQDLDEIEALRRALPSRVYFWANAYKRVRDYYAPPEIGRLNAVDSFFAQNLADHASLGRPCAAGDTAIAVDAQGTVRRCHFIDEPLGNLYTDSLESILAPAHLSPRNLQLLPRLHESRASPRPMGKRRRRGTRSTLKTGVIPNGCGPK